jgi:hypothetical protein
MRNTLTYPYLTARNRPSLHRSPGKPASLSPPLSLTDELGPPVIPPVPLSPTSYPYERTRAARKPAMGRARRPSVLARTRGPSRACP